MRISIGCDYDCRVDLYCSVEDRKERGERGEKVVSFSGLTWLERERRGGGGGECRTSCPTLALSTVFCVRIICIFYMIFVNNIFVLVDVNWSWNRNLL
jgi:hypothetical protein